MRETMRNPRYAIPFLLLSLVLCTIVALTAWGTAHTRTKDLKNIACATLKREVETKQSSLEAAAVFAKYSKAPEIQGFYSVQLPRRRQLLADARRSLKELDCGDDILVGP